MSVNSGPEAWLLDDGRAGHWRQVRALAHYLPLNCTVVRVGLKPPWSWFAPYRFPGGLSAHPGLLPVSAAIPQVIISCGRRSAVAARWLQAHFGDAPQTIQILDCGLSPDRFTWVVTPRHDLLVGDNVIQTIGSLNPVDENWLQGAPGVDVAGLALKGDSVLLLLGGPSRNHAFSRRGVRMELSRLRACIDGLEVTVVESPRTPGWVADDIKTLFSGLSMTHVPWLGNDPGACERKYRAALAMAGCVFVTADSVNLVSEACASGKPVFLLGADHVRGKMIHFCRQLVEQGYVHPHVPKRLEVGKMPTTRCLRETESVANRLIESGLTGSGSAF